MPNLKRERKVAGSAVPAITETNTVIEANKEESNENLELEEYKLAVQIQQHYHDLAYKTVTIYIAVSALSLGFVFRESVILQLKIIFCWFNLGISIFFVLSFLGFYLISKRIARRMDKLAQKLSFALRTHHALSYGIILTLLGGLGVLIFWIVTVILQLWNLGLLKQGDSQSNSILSLLGLA